MRLLTIENDFLRLIVSEHGYVFALLTYKNEQWIPLFADATRNKQFGKRIGTAEEFVLGGWWMFPYPARVCSPDGKPGVLQINGKDHSLGSGSYQQEFAIHGPACRGVWEFEVLTLEIAQLFRPQDNRELFPLPFSAEVKYKLEERNLRCYAKLTNTADTSKSANPDKEMPAGFGFHPFWVNSPLGIPDERPTIAFQSRQVWPKNAEGILLPSGRGCAPDTSVDFSGHGKTLPYELDHCFQRSGAVNLLWPESDINVCLNPDSPYDYIVIYSPTQGENEGLFDNTFALECQTCVSNGSALQAKGIDAGVRFLKPGESLEAGFSLHVN